MTHNKIVSSGVGKLRHNMLVGSSGVLGSQRTENPDGEFLAQHSHAEVGPRLPQPLYRVKIKLSKSQGSLCAK
jgi:hypothetical protein